jgi:predicted alpha-1,6-mannanase (GH76 family)
MPPNACVAHTSVPDDCRIVAIFHADGWARHHMNWTRQLDLPRSTTHNARLLHDPSIHLTASAALQGSVALSGVHRTTTPECDAIAGA